MSEHWKLSTGRHHSRSESNLARYGTTVVFLILATLINSLRPALSDAPYLLYYSAIILTAIYAGAGPAFASIGLSALLIRLLYIHPQFSLFFAGNAEGMERMGIFVLISLVTSSLVAAIKRERNALRESEERYRVLAETASDAIVVVNDRGSIIFVNPVAEKMFGARGDQIVGQNLNTLLPEEKYRAHLAKMKTHLDTRQKTVAMQLPVLRTGCEHLLVEMTLGAFTKHGQNLFTAIIRDITGQRKTERMA